MKVKRLKHVKKYISLFKNSFGIFEPYQVLIDGTFCQAALQNKINIKEQLPKYLDAEIQLLTTECVLNELQSLGGALYGALVIAKRFKTRKCGHTKSVSATDCVCSLIGEENEKRYFVATQDKELRKILRKKAGVPLLYINYNCIVMEKPSFVCCKMASAVQASRTEPTEFEKVTIERLKSTDGGGGELEIKRRKRKRVKGPNPLSCKKKKVKVDSSLSTSSKSKTDSSSSSRKRRRHKRKVPPTHLVQALKQNT